MGNQQIRCNCERLYNKSQLKQSAIIEVYNNSLFVKGNLNFQKQATYKKVEIAASQFCASTGIGVQYIPLIMRLLAFKHENVFQAFSTLPKQNRIEFMEKMGQIYLDLMDSLYQYLILNQDKNRKVKELKKSQLASFQGLAVENIKIEDKFDLVNKGKSLLRSSKVAIVFMCAGPSSRFYYQDKFLHPLQIQKKQTTLLQILFQKLRQNYGFQSKTEIIDIPIIIIGNQTNTDHIEDYLKQNKFFQFNKKNIFFSDIPSLPILDKQGKICLNFQYNYLKRPKGSASYLQQILHPQALQILNQKNIQFVHFVGTQNLAQSPGDPLLIGLTQMLKRKVSIKCTTPEHPFEKFDRIIRYKNNLRVFDLKTLQKIQKPQLFQSNIAMNSLVFEWKSLYSLVEKFNHSLHVGGLYRNIDINSKKPIINQQCWSFEKDIKDVIACTQLPLVLKVDRSEFIPLISVKDQFSITQACQKYTKLLQIKKLKMGKYIATQSSFFQSQESSQNNHQKKKK